MDLSKIKVSGDLCKKVLAGIVGQTANREKLGRKKGSMYGRGSGIGGERNQIELTSIDNPLRDVFL